MDIAKNNRRIAKNTLMLYFRQILTLLVSLYTVRVVLDVLGVEDYGIYAVVGGIVSLLSFLSGTMASATQRFFAFALGQKDKERLNKVLSVNLIIYVVIAVGALILLETIGLWYVNNKLHIPIERFESARVVYHFAVLTFIATILRSPFMALIIAYEDMQIYAYMSIIEAILKLGIVYLLVYISFDKLELYGILIFAVSLFTSLIYAVIAFYKYKDCRFKLSNWDKPMFKEITGFTGWTLFGQISTVTRNQAVTILMNQVFNPVIVAARAVALNVSSQTNIFSSNFNTSLYPPIIKYYAAGEKENMFTLLFHGSKITFFLMWVLALPLMIEMEAVLNLWLKNPPQYAVLFTQLSIVESVILSVSLPLTTAARAPGRMKTYELSLGLIQMAIFVVAWIVLRLGGAAYSVFIVAIVANIVMFFVRLYIVRNLIGLSVRRYIKQVIIPVVMVGFISILPSYLIHRTLPEGLIYSMISIVLSVVICLITMYYVGLEKYFRDRIKKTVLFKIKNIIRN